MEPGNEADPFLWDVGEVFKEYCTGDQVWANPPASKHPDIDDLAFNILDKEVNGQCLLTYRDVFGSLAPLVRDLGIRKVPHQLYFSTTVQKLQARSPAYRYWKRACLASQREGADELTQTCETPNPAAHQVSDSNRFQNAFRCPPFFFF